jgi:tRNA uridine 5-carboxymethylaminomethyl modification enzyme
MNAALFSQEKEAWTPRRDEAYIGVLIDDLITRGTLEPYRMFTSRAEYRLLLREDNADLRLTPKGYELGLVTNTQWQQFSIKHQAIEAEKERMKTTWVRPQTEIGAHIEALIQQPLTREYRLLDLLRRPHLTYNDLMSIAALNPGEIDSKVAEQVEIQIKYAGYIDRQSDEVARQLRNETTKIPKNINYQHVVGLSTEVQQKLTLAKPETIGQASRIPGVTPAAISLILVYLKKAKTDNVD